MPVPSAFKDRIMEELEPLGEVSARAMFGGYGVFEGGDMFALMAGSALFFKVDESNRAAYEEAGSPKYGPMPYFRVPDTILEDGGALEEWARLAISVGHATAKKATGKKKSGKKPTTKKS